MSLKEENERSRGRTKELKLRMDQVCCEMQSESDILPLLLSVAAVDVDDDGGIADVIGLDIFQLVASRLYQRK